MVVVLPVRHGDRQLLGGRVGQEVLEIGSSRKPSRLTCDSELNRIPAPTISNLPIALRVLERVEHHGSGMGKKVGAGTNLEGLFLEILIAKFTKAAKVHLERITEDTSLAHHFG